MTDFEHSSEVSASVEDVFAWHERPGAIHRLTPPWQPVRVLAEAASVRDGTAVLRLPGGLRWVASHQPGGYDPPRQFVDQLTGAPLGSVLSWRHTHLFRPVSDDRTRLTDRVSTSVPAAALRSMFVYRHRQLATDLAALARARAWRADGLTVAVTGASGLVGTAVCALLGTSGHRVVRLVRHTASGLLERQWNPKAPDADLLRGVDAVVHLAGAPIAGRFTDAHKAKVRDTRVGPTRALAELAARTQDGPRVFVSASAVGYYGADRGDLTLAEDAAPGSDFLSDVVQEWEAAGAPAASAGIRTVQVRTGIVQSPAGGTLQLLRPLFLAGLGGRLGSGDQWMSWIGIDDLADIYLRAVLDDDLSGPVNAVAPVPVQGREYTQVLGNVLRRPTLLPIPRLGPQLLLGSEGADELALASQRVVPARLQQSAHVFRHPQLEPALRHVLGKETRL